MRVSKAKAAGLWGAAAILWPLILLGVYQTSDPVIQGAGQDIIAFLLLMCLVAFFPIIVNETPVFFIQGISLSVFLYFGLFIEMVLTQAAVAVLLIKLKIPSQQSYRIPANLLMFLFVSLSGGTIYNLAGGQHGAIMLSDMDRLLQVMLYAAAIFAANQIFLMVVQLYMTGEKRPVFGKDAAWEALTSLLVFPVGLVLYMLYIEMGTVAILFVGIPFMTISLFVKLYYTSQKMNVYLQKASDIGHQLTGRMNSDDILDLFIEKIAGMLPVDFAYIIDVDRGRKTKLLRYFEAGQPADSRKGKNPFWRSDGITNRLMRTERNLLYHSRHEWRFLSKGVLPGDVESILAVPIQRNREIVGIILLASKQKRAFEKFQLTIVDILGSYLGVSLENARSYEQTKEESEKCSLTNVYNYRYMETYLASNFVELEGGNLRALSLIMLDLDHFKAINDTYGHQSGNEILIEVADRLKKITGDRGTVIRYGGEEFVVILPDMDRHRCFAFAEMARQTIAGKPFVLREHIQRENKSKEMIRITASFGIATAPVDADEPMALIRHADRAMYTGAKQKGRNKVAVYSS
ncbi:sensor domain-containing diguanylate cyclase [Bacillus marinisedimentorum]|uniref:sensor domain-containing diguanylate cyclase n=1 Tax=Bacillus marinisedimentorum TaxID=1821260 RepID=UPI0009F71C15|nr:sensor domain-containing diguanylate cyclase [Bacillus marinisedimentorum]